MTLADRGVLVKNREKGGMAGTEAFVASVVMLTGRAIIVAMIRTISIRDRSGNLLTEKIAPLHARNQPLGGEAEQKKNRQYGRDYPPHELEDSHKLPDAEKKKKPNIHTGAVDACRGMRLRHPWSINHLLITNRPTSFPTRTR